jgi:hypothetical protein
MFSDSALTFFPDGVKITGGLQSAFKNTKHLHRLDLRNYTSTGIYFNNAFNQSGIMELLVNEDFGKGIQNMAYAFYNSNITKLDYLDTSSVLDLASCFYGCTLLKELPTLDISKCTDLQYTFYSCTSLEYLVLTGSVD